MKLSLLDQEWFVKGYWPWVPLKDKSMETGKTVIGTTDWIPATVPGGVHYDLYKAGLIEHPYYEMNSLKCEWVEHRWWMYKTTMESPIEPGEKYELVFKGIDYEALVYMNGEYLGEHKGMYHPASFDITPFVLKKEKLELIVVFKHPPDEMGQIGKTSATFTQKSRFNYKWDFSTRLVNIGFWDEIYIKIHQQASFGAIALQTSVDQEKGWIHLDVGIQENVKLQDPLTLEVLCKDTVGQTVGYRTQAIHPGQHRGCLKLAIDNPDLWYPNGYGEQPLYKVELKLKDVAGRELDSTIYSAGIRQLAFTQNENNPEDALPYTVQVNGKKIYIQGFNMTPIDHLYGNVTKAHYEFLIKKIKRANANMVRVWGGGIIEKEVFYDLCDQHGILIWQEFIQSSSGIDNIPSKKPEFLELLKETAIAALKEKRNHVSLTIWSGGNELMDATFKPSTYEDETLAMLKDLAHALDPTRLFLPTSASGPVEFVTKKKGISHDVHGHWQFLGNPNHYELYGESDALFHSEFGTDGVSALKSLEKFLSPENLVPTTMSNHMVWRHHGEWWGTYNRDQALFGDIKEIDEFVACSQWIQAEGLRFILEANRRRAFQNSGSLIWQLNEPWPNASCTNLVDYYGEEKMAYLWARNAFSATHLSLDYRKLNFLPGERFEAGVYGHGGNREKVHMRWQILTTSGDVLFQMDKTMVLDPLHATRIGDLTFEIGTQHGDLFFVRLQLLDGERVNHESLYIFSTKETTLYAPALQLTKGKLDVQPLGDWKPVEEGSDSLTRQYEVENSGSEAILHLSMTETTNNFWMEPSENFVTLFPGEKRLFTIQCHVKKAGGFLSEESPGTGRSTVEPIIRFQHFAERV